MDKEFLLQQGLTEETAQTILQAHAQVVAGFEDRIRLMGAEHALKQAVTAAGGRNFKAISALVDRQAIEESQDMEAAAIGALEAIRRENPYLFASSAAYAPGTGTAQNPGGYTMEQLGKMSLAQYRQYRKGN